MLANDLLHQKFEIRCLFLVLLQLLERPKLLKSRLFEVQINVETAQYHSTRRFE